MVRSENIEWITIFYRDKFDINRRRDVLKKEILEIKWQINNILSDLIKLKKEVEQEQFQNKEKVNQVLSLFFEYLNLQRILEQKEEKLENIRTIRKNKRKPK